MVWDGTHSLPDYEPAISQPWLGIVPTHFLTTNLLFHSHDLGWYPLTSCLCTGTKWCGAGDLADNYFDLGVEAMLDKCCRTHDLCPVKVRAYTSRYNLTNNSLYTKSHCTCDAILLQCLKDAQHSTADIMGNIYFNLLKVPCVRQGKDRTTFQPAERYDNPIIRG
ncbi:hypothetical protein J6590_042926 [Homalodisca vitripennis]|nr:hypothetical protein J6590_042926 [Homalodisca vitripennis]